jgi:hypothetical protein
VGNDRWVAAVAHKYNAGNERERTGSPRTRCGWAELRRGVAFGVQGCERVLDLGIGATNLVGHNRDAPETVPRHGRLRV